MTVAFALASAGCSISSSANAKHTGGPQACSDDSSSVVIDVLLAAAATGVLYLTGDLDDSPAWLAVPGVFIASGTAGVFLTRSCARRQRAAARDADVPERGPPKPPPSPPVELPRPHAKPPEVPARRACSIEPLVECDPARECALEDGNRGYCVPDR